MFSVLHTFFYNTIQQNTYIYIPATLFSPYMRSYAKPHRIPNVCVTWVKIFRQSTKKIKMKMTNEFLGAVRLRGVSNLFKVAHCRLNFTQAQASKCEMVLAITPYIALIFSCIFKQSRKEIYQLQSYTYTYKWFNIKPCSMYCGCKNNWAVPTNRHRY